MSKKTVAVDLDDVVADSTDTLRLLVNKVAKVNLTRKHYDIDGRYWGYYEKVWAENQIDHLVSFESLHDDMAKNQDHVELIPGAKNALSQLKKTYKLVAVTSRRLEWVKATHEWLALKLPEVFEDVIFVHHNNNDGRTKGDVCIEAGASYLVDDNPEHCQSAIDKGVKTILFGDYGWNRSVKASEKTMRAKNWQEVLEYFDNER